MVIDGRQQPAEQLFELRLREGVGLERLNQFHFSDFDNGIFKRQSTLIEVLTVSNHRFQILVAGADAIGDMRVVVMSADESSLQMPRFGYYFRSSGTSPLSFCAADRIEAGCGMCFEFRAGKSIWQCMTSRVQSSGIRVLPEADTTYFREVQVLAETPGLLEMNPLGPTGDSLDEQQKAMLALAQRFCPEVCDTLRSILTEAAQCGRLVKTMAKIERWYGAHWRHQPWGVRGQAVFEQDVAIWTRIVHDMRQEGA